MVKDVYWYIDEVNRLNKLLCEESIKSIEAEMRLRQAVAYMEGYFGTEPEGESPLKYLKSLLEDM